MSDALTAKEVCDIINRVTLPEGERRTQWVAFVNAEARDKELVGLPRTWSDEEVMECLREYKARRAVQGEGAADVPLTVVLKYGGKQPLELTRRVSKHTYRNLCKAVEGNWRDLAVVDYELSCAGVVIKDESDLQAALDAALTASRYKQITKQKEEAVVPTAAITVTNLCKGFTEFSLEDALLYLGCEQASIPEDDSAFDAPELSEQETEELKLLAHEVHRRIPIFGPFHEAAEYTNREFIGPVLLCAARIVTGIMLRAEYQLKGTLGNGPADYVALYQELAIVIAEAKHCKVEDALPQNLAQVAASREQSVNRLDRAKTREGPGCGTKRKAHEVDILQHVPTSGIATTGLHYIFMRYEQYPVPRVYKSSEWLLPLDKQQSPEAVVKCLEPVVRRIVGILRLQKSAVDSQLKG